MRDIVQAMYQGMRVAVLISRPVSTEPLAYRTLWLEGNANGTYITALHEDLQFIDPVVVTTQSYLGGLTTNLEPLVDEVRARLTAADDDHHDALLLAALTRFFQAWDRAQEASTGPIAHPNRDA